MSKLKHEYLNKLFSMKYKLITFDASNTILKLRNTPGVQYSKLAKRNDIKVDEKQLESSFKENFKIFSKTYPNYGKKRMGWRNWWEQLLTCTFEDAKCKGSPQQIRGLANDLIEMYKTEHSWQPMPGVYSLVNYLQYRKTPIGVISNFDPRLHEILEETQLNPYFRFVLTSYETGNPKPNSLMFQQAMAKSGIKNLKPQQCLHIGDDVKKDYFGALDCNWNSILLSNGQSPEDFVKEHPDVDPKHIHTSLDSVLKHIIKLFQTHDYYAANKNKIEHTSREVLYEARQ